MRIVNIIYTLSIKINILNERYGNASKILKGYKQMHGLIIWVNQNMGNMHTHRHSHTSEQTCK